MNEQRKGVTRREALALLGGGAALLMAGTAGRPAPVYGQPAYGQPGQLIRNIPATGEGLPAVGLGTAVTFDVGNDPAKRAPLPEVVRQFVAAGGRLIDTAPSYGASEEIIGEIVRSQGLRGKVFLSTKVGASNMAEGLEQLNTSVRLLGEGIDLIEVHNLKDWKNQLARLREWKAAGRIRYLGVTHYTERSLDAMIRVVGQEQLDFIQINYSVREREADAKLLPLCRERGVAVLVNRPFARAGLFRAVRAKPLPAWAAEFDCASWAQFFLKFIVSNPAVTCALPATSNPKHVLDNMGAGLGRQPDAAQRKRMAEYFDAI
ncbi:MAG: aldo/keto reductase [Candidatus Lambdaproteobacteria bacterium]|nr:aldo/keto reductase [Candidatus Lambdaproteobacteria bacterium]